jgi:hypothetical protein
MATTLPTPTDDSNDNDEDYDYSHTISSRNQPARHIYWYTAPPNTTLIHPQ